MPVCIECGKEVPVLYLDYGKGNIKLVHCEVCKTFADKYLEYDFVIIFIDMLLHKRPVYRHLIFNRLDYSDQGWNGSLIRLGILLVLFEVYLKWFRLDRMDRAVAPDNVALHTQYFYILGVCALETICFHSGVRWATHMLFSGKFTVKNLNQLSMALVLSSFGKILLIVMVVWDYGQFDPSILVNMLVFTSNIEALSVFLKTSISTTGVILGAGITCKLAIQFLMQLSDPNIELSFI
ncbi:hypothetical protein BASA50_006006 [Batrachochytrium salamandrivorans]|uniref:Protein ARV n=1 Tax=Batrachochytrium salamandrivorans TaxID=1357716 RepID=A0ABQ8FB38_9FUNG|nr:hypothetical protein BASA60_009997 [Batrachochytrium salamandrivorans]KAH6567424.1 hypothetical protein BASA62_006117 [Batrachochytrium salamandrivorans]KAH6582518.1 hypothetical protein BASA61_008491 [Batrachochytrium salamandrivorans]KAH6595212.1 hypothetical protein BASA50_006006 [Batrachochytrium salamandrivorans]KAH9254793.1 hypothetical protein BASA81_007213 [Batrachochytrium salamandrivorans]